MIFRLHAEWYVGNYEKLILISQTGYKTSKNLEKKCVYLIFLARAYFELYNIDKLKQITNTFFQLKEKNPTRETLFSKYKIFSFYKSFINEDYTECINYVENQLKHLNIRKPGDNLKWLTQRTNYAICFYWQDNKQKAKELFEYFKQNTPHLANFYKLAERYLSAIEHNNSSIIKKTTYDDVKTSDFEYQTLSLRKRIKKKRIIFSILLFIFCGFLMSSEIIDYMDNINSQSEYSNDVIAYENDLNSAISKNYDNAKFIKYFNVRDGEQHIDAFCLIDTGDGWDLANIVTYDGGETLDLMLLGENIQIERDYTVKSTTSNYQIALYISDKPLSSSDYKQIIEYSHNDTNYWFGIKQTTQLP